MCLKLEELIFLLPITPHVAMPILRKYNNLFTLDFDAVKRFPSTNPALSSSLVFIQIPLPASIKLLRLFIINNQRTAFDLFKKYSLPLWMFFFREFIFFTM